MIEPSLLSDVQRVHASGLGVTGYTYLVQAMLGIPSLGIPIVDSCAICSKGVNPVVHRSNTDSLIVHAGSHAELLNSFIHKPVVTELVRFFRVHGFATCAGDYGGDHRHSADLTVLHYYSPGEHLRIDVKSSCDFNKSNRKRCLALHLTQKERNCRIQHLGSRVLPFVVTASGAMGPEAIKLLSALTSRGVGSSEVQREMELSWLVPSHGKYWHRRFRGIVLAGWADVVRACAGARFDGELYADASADEPSMAILYSMMRTFEGDRDCPLCNRCRLECVCFCDPAHGGCATVRRSESAWPMCRACLTCGSCCRC